MALGCYVRGARVESLVWTSKNDQHDQHEYIATVFGSLPGAHPYKTQESFKINHVMYWIECGKSSFSMLPVRLLANMICSCKFGNLREIGGLARGCCFSGALAESLVSISQNVYKKCLKLLQQPFLKVFLGLTLTGPKKAFKNNNYDVLERMRKKLLFDVANPATCYLRTIGGALAKSLVWTSNKD